MNEVLALKRDIRQPEKLLSAVGSKPNKLFATVGNGVMDGGTFDMYKIAPLGVRFPFEERN